MDRIYTPTPHEHTAARTSHLEAHTAVFTAHLVRVYYTPTPHLEAHTAAPTRAPLPQMPV